jgi:signal transduction histidine kinase
LLFCLCGVVLGIPAPAGFIALAVVSPRLLVGMPGPHPLASLAVVAGVLVVLPLAVVASGAARRLGRAWRHLAAALLGQDVAGPPPLAGRWLGPRMGDGPGWRSVTYLLVKLPVGALEGYAAFFWVGGLINLSYPFWWQEMRNHPPGVRLSPVPVYTPIGYFGQGTFRVATFPGTSAAFAAGAVMLLAAPWACRAVVLADRWLIERLLGPGRMAQRVADLDRARALAVDDSAATLRRLERDLHDGAQIGLATLAMNLGMAKKKLGEDGDPPDLAATRELVDAAHRGAKTALAELRAIALGIHPPALDSGLADALATLAASSAIPVDLTVSLPARPSPAIETIAYFCAAELLANAAKHSEAGMITMTVAGSAEQLTVLVADDGRGGADPAGGSGLSGLAQRVRTVDGRLGITSPPGGPTKVIVTLPIRA